MDKPTMYAILRYLGWPVRTIDPTSVSYSSYISQQLSLFPADALSILTGLVSRVATIDLELQAMISRANVKAIDDIQFFEDGTFDLRRERSRVITEISCMVDIGPGPGFSGGAMTSVQV